MRTPNLGTPLLLVAALTASIPAAAQLLDQGLCSTLVVDQEAENGFTIGPGQTSIEFCSREFVPATSQGFNCTWGGAYHLDKHASAWTSLSAQLPVGLEFGFRRDQAGEPGAMVDPQPTPGTIPVPGVFPNCELGVQDSYDEFTPYNNQRLHNRWLLLEDDPRVWSCATLTQDAANHFVSVDRSLTTPPQSCRVRGDGGPFELCSLQDSQLRALGVGAHVAPLAGFASSDQIVPPIPVVRSGRLSVYFDGPPLPAEPPTGTNSFRFLIEHQVENPVSAHLHLGGKGENGPIIYTFTSPTSPIDEGGVVLLPSEVDQMGRNRMYVDVHSDSYPNGEIRGQIVPAGGMFRDDFESGNTSAWSSATQ